MSARIPEVLEKSTSLAATYLILVFTIIVQGLSLRPLVGTTAS